jgi:hypothetical protein
MDPMIPPIPHRLSRHKLFDFIAEAHIGQLQALVECILVNCPDGGGDYNTLEQCAPGKCILPNLLQPLAKNYNHQL